MTAKNQVKRKMLVAELPESQHDAEGKFGTGGDSKKIDPNAVAESENELDFWLKGHMTGEKRERDSEENRFDEKTAVKNLEKRMNALETQMGDLLTRIKDGFETMEASQEVAFRAFYNAQKRIRSSPTKMPQSN